MLFPLPKIAVTQPGLTEVWEHRSIRVLPDDIVARIAAGEVITRPRAAVRELVDNAIDSGATRIDIDVDAGGFDRIAVHDDGCGIAESDAPVLFTRHATSKLDSFDALTHMRTLGFRGEALASMAAVADVVVRSRSAASHVGVQVTCAFAGDVRVTPLSRQIGTSVEVRDLFQRYPVRRSSADPGAESRVIRRLISNLGLINPGIAFSLRVDGRAVLRSDGGELRGAFASVYGADALAAMVDLGFAVVEGGDARVHGIISGPAAHRGNRDGIVLAINGRLCQVPDVQRAIERAYRDILPRQRFPHVVLTIDVPPHRVDVNVHPSKERVTLHDARTLSTAIERELRSVLGRTTHLVSEKRSLALQLADLPGQRIGESPEAYAVDWGTRIVEAGSLPRLRVVGQVEDTLIVCESDLGTLLIDQHRAHERVIFERMLVREAAMLSEPVVVALPAHVLQTLDVRQDDLFAAGWQWHEFGPGQLLVSACPIDLQPDDLAAIAERFSMETAHSIVAAAACHAAIRKRRPLTPEAATELVTSLSATPTPTTCPHGQPIVINLDRNFFERQFGWR